MKKLDPVTLQSKAEVCILNGSNYLPGVKSERSKGQIHVLAPLHAFSIPRVSSEEYFTGHDICYKAVEITQCQCEACLQF